MRFWWRNVVMAPEGDPAAGGGGGAAPATPAGTPAAAVSPALATPVAAAPTSLVDVVKQGGAKAPDGKGLAAPADGKGARPDYVPEKFWTVGEDGKPNVEATLEKMAKSYAGLESKLGGHKGAPVGEDGKPAPYDLKFGNGYEKMVKPLDAESAEMKTFSELFHKHGISQEAATDLIQAYVETQFTDAMGVYKAELEQLGDDGPKMVEAIAQWAQANLDQEGIDTLQSALQSAASVKAFKMLIENHLSGVPRIPVDPSIPTGTRTIDDIRATIATKEYGEDSARGAALRKRVEGELQAWYKSHPEDERRVTSGARPVAHPL